MAKNRDAFDVGYPLYMCRLCGEFHTDSLVPLWDWYSDIDLAECSRAPACSVYDIHNCSNGNRGLSDLQGLIGLRSAIKDRWDRYVDPESEQEIPSSPSGLLLQLRPCGSTTRRSVHHNEDMEGG